MEGTHGLEEMWQNITLLPQGRGCRWRSSHGLTVGISAPITHPPLSRGSHQIMGSLAGWKRLIEVVPSKANGITFDCGVAREMGEDPVEVCRWHLRRI